MTLRVGLTGGIASGKTMVAIAFAGLGAGVVDTDRVARDVVAPGEPGLDAVRLEFGGAMILESGELDRRALRAAVFSDPAKRRKLEALLHPLIRTRTLEELERLSAPYAVVVVPLLVETGFGRLVDRVVAVDCPRQTQLKRLVDRDRIDLDQARAMLNAQADREVRLAEADDVIDNGGDRDFTHRQVRSLHARYLSLSGHVCSTQQSPAE